jgi:rSAM/selenodomain-associated transferase 1
MTFRIIVFLKAPRPGEVKTRLAASIGPEGACQAYLELSDTFLKQLVSFTQVELRFSPDDAVLEIESFKMHPDWMLMPQGPGDLGQRMERSVQDALTEVDAVLCVGTDCPYIRKTDIDQALEILRDQDAVVGPAADGGYWAIGLRRQESTLFQEMPWSTPGVLGITRQRLQAANMTFRELRELEDVDDFEAWKKYVGWAG